MTVHVMSLALLRRDVIGRSRERKKQGTNRVVESEREEESERERERCRVKEDCILRRRDEVGRKVEGLKSCESHWEGLS